MIDVACVRLGLVQEGSGSATGRPGALRQMRSDRRQTCIAQVGLVPTGLAAKSSAGTPEAQTRPAARQPCARNPWSRLLAGVLGQKALNGLRGERH